MEAIQQVERASSVEAQNRKISEIAELCTLNFESGERYYDVRLLADIASIARESMNQYRINILGRHKESGFIEQMQTVVEINIREAMHCISIEGEAPLYFTTTLKSSHLSDAQIDSSIHEAVDQGLQEVHASAGNQDNGVLQQDSLLADKVAANLIKAGVSTLLAQTLHCHKQVIGIAKHQLASRQDFVRVMCHCLESNAADLANSLSTKAQFCDQGKRE